MILRDYVVLILLFVLIYAFDRLVDHPSTILGVDGAKPLNTQHSERDNAKLKYHQASSVNTNNNKKINIIIPSAAPLSVKREQLMSFASSFSGNDVLNTLQIQKKKIIFISIGIKEHVIPLYRLAYAVSLLGKDDIQILFISNSNARQWIESEEYYEESTIQILTMGEYLWTNASRKKIIADISKEPSLFKGILSLFSEIYLPSTYTTYRSVKSIVETMGKPDLFVIDIGTIGGLEVAQSFKIPVILNSPSLLFSLDPSKNRAAYVPAWGSGIGVKNMTMWEKCVNLLYPRLLSVALTHAFIQINKFRTEFGLPIYRTQHDIFADEKILVNTAFGLEYAQVRSPLVDYIGPMLPITAFTSFDVRKKIELEHKEHILPHGLISWLDGDANEDVLGTLSLIDQNQNNKDNKNKDKIVLYVNFGTFVEPERWQFDNLMESLSDPRWTKVLWAVQKDQRSMLRQPYPHNFRIKNIDGSYVITRPSNIPGMDIYVSTKSAKKGNCYQSTHLTMLMHPSVKAIISHCSMAAAQEVLFFGKPLLCIPFLSEQYDTAARVVDKGAGIMINKQDMSIDSIKSALYELTSNPKYTLAARNISLLLKLAGGASQGARIILNTLDQKGHPHLVSPRLAWHKSPGIDLDITALILSLCIAVGVGMYYVNSHFVKSYMFLFSPSPSSSNANANQENSGDSLSHPNAIHTQNNISAHHHPTNHRQISPRANNSSTNFN